VADVEKVSSGASFMAAVRFQIEEGWHLYWRNPGDSGEAPRVSWMLPSGFGVGELLWPYPKRIEMPPLTNFGYEGETFLFCEITPPLAGLDSSTPITLGARVEWLVCKEICLPGSADVHLTLPVQGEGMPVFSRWANPMATHLRRVPQKMSDWRIFPEFDREGIILELEWEPRKVPAILPSEFFPIDEGVVALRPARFDLMENGLHIFLPRADRGAE